MQISIDWDWENKGDQFWNLVTESVLWPWQSGRDWSKQRKTAQERTKGPPSLASKGISFEIKASMFWTSATEKTEQPSLENNRHS